MAAKLPGLPGVHPLGMPPIPPLGDAVRNPGRHHVDDSRHVARVFLSRRQMKNLVRCPRNSSAYGVWLDPTVRDVEPLQTLLMPDPADEMTAYPISTRVNKPAYDAPECIIPLT
jgi:hypothetical protein